MFLGARKIIFSIIQIKSARQIIFSTSKEDYVRTIQEKAKRKAASKVAGS